MTPSIFSDSRPQSSKVSALRSILPSGGHKRSKSAFEAAVRGGPVHHNNPLAANCLLPADHPHYRPQQHHQQPYPDREANRNASNSRAPLQDNSNPPGKTLHKRSKSTLSLKSLLKDKNSKDKDQTQKEPVKHEKHEPTPRRNKPKRTKSSTSLSSLFRKHQSRPKDNDSGSRDKENFSPVDIFDDSASAAPGVYTAHLPPDNSSGSRYVPENRRTVAEEMSLYTPQGYSPSKQRNFHDHHKPSLTRADKARRKSDSIPSTSAGVREMLATGRKPSPLGPHNSNLPERKISSSSNSQASTKSNEAPAKRRVSNGRRSSRVMAAIAAFNAKDQQAASTKQADPKDTAIENAFEQLLESRNIPLNMRDKMRALDTNIKADFVNKHEMTPTTPSGTSQKKFGFFSSDKEAEKSSENGSRKSATKTRARSRTFTKNDSSNSKKGKGETTPSKRPKSVDFSRPSSSSSRGISASVLSSLQYIRTPKDADEPSDFVHYLKEVQKPEIVEISKLHKLRILLRNETVTWVTEFMSCGGMDELIQLLYRIIKVEWREEHEDTLMHEVLLCLKALCTTTTALNHIRSIESHLFPTLLNMLFDDEKKGPSEFSTRAIIISLLFTLLSNAGPGERTSRAHTILSYMRDPAPPETAQPLSFIADIYQPRPYRVWCKEVTNVTKEVFWMFLHHYNVVPVTTSEDGPVDPSQPYSERHFPPPHPPVPAAPYIGGVEWEATSYLAIHLDLMNGIIASMPTTEERNKLRTDLKASGFEKVMGRSLRTCKEQFYPALHAGLKVWVAAAAEDGWDYQFVREGPPRDVPPSSPIKTAGNQSPKKRPGIVSEAPPRLDLNVGVASPDQRKSSGDWL
ncbi:hypothetical protein H109_01064 [Trichophyton interdigitale MR816]|uniref:Formin GTPase-binding domain-containing protein n=1 Tax=Trichophyton interdigitale (strain MR816) TaxID=1215338 RepID=A0A059JH84_TRIIM|nr:hypothetical protein H109_01064 [Trichophyton interdigitale MR816]